MQDRTDETVQEHDAVGRTCDCPQELLEIGRGSKLCGLNQEWCVADRFSQSSRDRAAEFGIEVNGSFRGANVRTGEIGFDYISACFDRPLGATAEVGGQVSNRH